METHVILMVGSVLLCGGCGGLVLVRLSNPSLKGVGWLGGAFAAGTLGAIAMTLRQDGLPQVSVLFPDMLFLLAYVLLQVCLQELLEHERRFPRTGVAMLVLQAVAFAYIHKMTRVTQLNLTISGLLLATQACANVVLLARADREGIRTPVRYLMVLLLIFAGFNVFRSGRVMAVGIPKDPLLHNPLELAAALVFLGAAMGIGFGVFWLTSSQLRLSLEEQANTDPLTGVANRRAFLRACELELQRSRRTGTIFSLVLLDLDHFKRINDAYGHNTGDLVLREAANRMVRSLRRIDVLGRWGGEEFVALLPGAGAEMAHRVAERLRGSIEALRIAHGRGPGISAVAISTTVSLGVATYPAQARDLNELFTLCDRALYRAKANGRNRIVCAGDPEEELMSSLRTLA